MPNLTGSPIFQNFVRELEETDYALPDIWDDPHQIFLNNDKFLKDGLDAYLALNLGGRTNTLEAWRTSHSSASVLDHPDNSVTAAKLFSTAITDKLGYTPVSKLGDTMTGALTLPVLNTNAGTSAGGAQHQAFTAAGATRFASGLSTVEGGGNSGSNYSFWRYSDAGVFLGAVYNISRSSGAIDFTGTLTRAGNTIWDSGNDGIGSGMDTDLIRGLAPGAASGAATLTAGSRLVQSPQDGTITAAHLNSGAAVTNLGFTPENVAARGAASGYASLTAGSRLAQDVRDLSVNTQHLIDSSVTNAKILNGTIDLLSKGSFVPVNRNGDGLIAGVLTSNAAINGVEIRSRAANGIGDFALQTPAGAARWNIYKNVTEAGSNSGSDLTIARYNDAGAIIGSALTINRATGNVVVTSDLGAANINASGQVIAASGGGNGLRANGSAGAFSSLGWDAANGRTRFVSWNGAASAPYNFENGPLQAQGYRIGTTDVVDSSRNGFLQTIATLAGTGAGGSSHISLQTSSLSRFQLGLSSVESGSNSGSDFSLWRYNDAGAFIADIFIVSRATGVLNFNQTPTAAGVALAKTSDLSSYLTTAAASSTYAPLAGNPIARRAATLSSNAISGQNFTSGQIQRFSTGMSGVVVGDFILCSFDTANPTTFFLEVSAFVNAVNSISVLVRNPTASNQIYTGNLIFTAIKN